MTNNKDIQILPSTSSAQSHLKPTVIQNKEQALAHLRQNYLNPRHAISFRGVSNIYNYYDGLLSKEDVEEALSTFKTYVTHKEIKKVPQFNPQFVYQKRQLVQVDLVQLVDEVSAANSNHRYIMVAIDAFTRKFFVRLIPTKSAVAVTQAFEDIIREMSQGSKAAESVLSDRGSEFTNRAWKSLMKKCRAVTEST